MRGKGKEGNLEEQSQKKSEGMYAPSSRIKKVVAVEMWPLVEIELYLRVSEVHKLAMNKAIYIGCSIANCVLLDRLGSKNRTRIRKMLLAGKQVKHKN